MIQPVVGRGAALEEMVCYLMKQQAPQHTHIQNLQRFLCRIRRSPVGFVVSVPSNLHSHHSVRSLRHVGRCLRWNRLTREASGKRNPCDVNIDIRMYLQYNICMSFTSRSRSARCTFVRDYLLSWARDFLREDP